MAKPCILHWTINTSTPRVLTCGVSQHAKLVLNLSTYRQRFYEQHQVSHVTRRACKRKSSVLHICQTPSMMDLYSSWTLNWYKWRKKQDSRGKRKRKRRGCAGVFVEVTFNNWVKYGLTSHQTHYKDDFTDQMTQPTVSKHWRTIVGQSTRSRANSTLYKVKWSK